MKDYQGNMLTMSQAYDVAFHFLEVLFEQEQPNDDLGALLGGMQRFSGGKLADPAYCADWMLSYWERIVAPTVEEQQQFHDLIADPANYAGTTASGSWYAIVLPDNQQIWANVWGNTFQYGGKNKRHRTFDFLNDFDEIKYIEKITLGQAYETLQKFLEQYVQRGTETEYLQNLFRRMQLSDGHPADHKIGLLWQAIVENISKQPKRKYKRPLGGRDNARI